MRHIHVSCFMVFPIQVHHRCIDPIDFIDISRCSGLYCKARLGFQAEEPAKKKLKNSQHTSTHQTCLSYGGLCYVQNAFASIFGEIPKFLQISRPSRRRVCGSATCSCTAPKAPTTVTSSTPSTRRPWRRPR